MGQLHPDTFSLRHLKNESERRVVEALLDYTDERWIILPSVVIGDEPPVEVDVVVAHPEHGFAVIEIKGWTNPTIVNGEWNSPHKNPGRNPVDQLLHNRYAVRDRLRDVLPHVEVDAALAFPLVGGVKGGNQIVDIGPHQLIWSHNLETIEESLLQIMTRGVEGRLMYTEDTFAQFLEALRPNVQFNPDTNTARRIALDKLNDRTIEQLRALERLDQNRKVFVSGGAGSGKSRLATSWAQRALQRDERVLLMCFNDPLGKEFEDRFADTDGIIVTGPFLRVALDMPGMPDCDRKEGESEQDYWNSTVQGHLHLHWHRLTEQYDTIIIDEAQDFSPSWIAMLTALLDPEGENRVLIVGDLGQELHKRGFRPPSPADGWTIAELGPNVRNSRAIAQMLRSKLNGPPAPHWLPSTALLEFAEITKNSGICQTVDASVLKLVEEGFDPTSIAVVCLGSAVRSELWSTGNYASFEDLEATKILCDSAHRLKGLEYEAVIVATNQWPVNEAVLYVALSRAVHALIVCGPRTLGDRLGL